MARKIRWLLAVCLVAIAAVIVLQFYWIRNYYQTSLYQFEREANLAVEDALRKDFQLRCDTIEQLLTGQLMDTSAFRIESKYLPKLETVTHRVINASNKKDLTSFSHPGLPDLLQKGDTAYKRKIAQTFARNLRTEDLENHVVYYRIQSLGQFTTDKVQQYGFDSSRFRTVLQKVLAQRHIVSGFHFFLSPEDSLQHYATKPARLAQEAGVITKAHPTYKWWTANEQFIRVVFEHPAGYVFAHMKWILAGSLLLILLVAFCIWLLLQALFQEKKIAAMKNNFINNITHELKTPVATIAAAIEALANFDLNKEKSSRYLSHAKNETRKLENLIDQILHISIREEKGMSVRMEAFNFEHRIQDIIHTSRMASSKTLRYQFINDTGIREITADIHLFEIAMRNIIDNAIKYSGDEADLLISCCYDNHYLHLRCSDKGDGIAVSSLPYVFDKFYREPMPHHAVKGYGLGLYHVQQIMQAHHGTVAIESTKGEGSTVILSWPM